MTEPQKNNILQVHSINGYALSQDGWEYVGKDKYTKGEKEIIKDGLVWKYNGNPVQFMEEIK